jgi:3-ketosteroid 9alpha-monooxygenase subunit A
VKAWRVVEKLGCIFVWYDPETGEPDYDLPDLVEYNDPAWIHWRIDQLGILNMHPQELVDNIADYPHLRPIHGFQPASFQNEFRGHMARQTNSGSHGALGSSDSFLSNDVFYFGPAVLLSRVCGMFEAIELLAHTPVEDGTMRVWHGLMVKGKSTIATAEDIAGAREFQDTGLEALSQDFDIWKNKAPCINILQVADDGPFGKARIWYRQFYNPRAEAAKIMSRAEGVHGVLGVPGASSFPSWQPMPTDS